MTEDNFDGLETLAEKLDILRSPWDRHYHPETGRLGWIMPKTAKSDSDFEARAIQMHANQEVLRIDAKPVENVLSQIQRGD